jgi:hypothetical protein
VTSFRDMTFCEARCVNRACPRRWTNDLAQQAKIWSWTTGDVGTVSMADFTGDCPDFQPEQPARSEQAEGGA